MGALSLIVVINLLNRKMAQVKGNIQKMHNIEMIPYEFAVQVTCEACVCKIKKAIEEAPEFENTNLRHFIEKWDIDIPSQTFYCETSLPGYKMLEILRRSGLEVRLKTAGHPSHPAAVVEFHNVIKNDVVGVIRFIPMSKLWYVLEGSFSGLPQGDSTLSYTISIHEAGDLSKPPESCGRLFEAEGVCDGTLNRFLNPKQFYFHNVHMFMPKIIGRSCVIKKQKYGVEEIVAVGIVARSAGVYANPKMFCTCDGVSIFDERKLVDRF